jgi:allantoin racemase
MKLLIINPNTTEAVTDLVAKAARAAASRGTTVYSVTGKFGPKVIGSRAENAIAAHACLELAAKHAKGCDAVVLGVSLDSALWALREQLDVPVLGMNESGVLVASTVASRYAVLTFGQRMIPFYRELIEQQGMAARLSGIAAVDFPATAVFNDLKAVQRDTVAKCRELISGGAEALLLSGAAYAGMRAGLQKSVPVPLLDGVQCAVALAESLVRLGLPKPSAGTLAKPRGRETVGLDPALTRLLKN